ncbi:MAG: sulfotransferase family 2 domain-containing protein [Bacteroidota bacterium]
MFNLFKSTRSKEVVPVEIELLSVHIPKTAGTSFRNILKQVYGEQAVLRLDISLKDGVLRLNEQESQANALPAHTQVVHGHFSPALLRQRFDLRGDIPMITWLRHPVERVISNYFYLEKRLQEELQEEAKGLDILRKMQRSLMEYARDEVNRNRQHKFLDGIRLSELAFVGIQEHYSDDLLALAQLFDWPAFEELHHNRTAQKRRAVSEAERSEIAQLNALDMALYEEALNLRKKRSS